MLSAVYYLEEVPLIYSTYDGAFSWTNLISHISCVENFYLFIIYLFIYRQHHTLITIYKLSNKKLLTAHNLLRNFLADSECQFKR